MNKTVTKIYSLKQLYHLWIKWGDENDIMFQKMFRVFKLKGSFVQWLELREDKSANKAVKIKKFDIILISALGIIIGFLFGGLLNEVF